MEKRSSSAPACNALTDIPRRGEHRACPCPQRDGRRAGARKPPGGRLAICGWQALDSPPGESNPSPEAHRLELKRAGRENYPPPFKETAR